MPVTPHSFNVYEDLQKLDELMGDEHKEPSSMDLSEYRILQSKIVRGTVELLQHLAQHNMLMCGSDDHLHSLDPGHIEELRHGNSEAFSEVAVKIEVPECDDLAQDILDDATTINPGAMADSADMLVAIQLHNKMKRYNDIEHIDIFDLLFARWEEQVQKIAPQATRYLEQLDAAGLLGVYDQRTGARYEILFVGGGPSDDENEIHAVIATHSDAQIAKANKELAARVKKNTNAKAASNVTPLR